MFNRITNYFTSALEELKKIVWPNRQEVTNHTVIVVSAIIISMIILALLDLGLFNILEILIYKNY